MTCTNCIMSAIFGLLYQLLARHTRDHLLFLDFLLLQTEVFKLSLFWRKHGNPVGKTAMLAAMLLFLLDLLLLLLSLLGLLGQASRLLPLTTSSVILKACFVESNEVQRTPAMMPEVAEGRTIAKGCTTSTRSGLSSTSWQAECPGALIVFTEGKMVKIDPQISTESTRLCLLLSSSLLCCGLARGKRRSTAKPRCWCCMRCSGLGCRRRLWLRLRLSLTANDSTHKTRYKHHNQQIYL